MNLNFFTGLFSSFLVILSSIIGILLDNDSINFKVIAICIAIISGITSLIILYNTNKESDYNKKILESLLRANTPLDEMYDEVSKFVHLKVKKLGLWVKTEHFAVKGIGKLYTIRYSNDALGMEEYILLSVSTILKAYLSPQKNRLKIIEQGAFEMWGKDDLKKDWELINTKTEAYIRYWIALNTKGIVCGFKYPQAMTLEVFLLDNFSDRKLIISKVILNTEDFCHLLQLTVIKRGTFIINRTNQILEELFTES